MLLSGSTDVGDVSWVVPTAQITTACLVFGTPGHSWQTVARGKSGFAHRVMLAAAKIMARTAADVLLNPSLAVKARAKLQETLEETPYKNPIPPEVQPAIPTAGK